MRSIAPRSGRISRTREPMQRLVDVDEELIVGRGLQRQRSARLRLLNGLIDRANLAAIHGEPEEHAGGETGSRGARNPAARGPQHAMHGGVRRHALVRKCDDLGRMVVALDAPHDAIALIVKPLGGEYGVGLADSGFVHLLQRAHQIVEARLARTADGEMTIVAGQHAGLHQLIVAQMCSHMRVPEIDDAVLKSHGAALPWPCAVCGWRGTDEPSRSTRSSRSSRRHRASSDPSNDRA